MKYDLTRYHWRALFVCARIAGYPLQRVANVTGIKHCLIIAYSAYSYSRSRRYPNNETGPVLVDFFYSILEPHMIRVCTKYD